MGRSRRQLRGGTHESCRWRPRADHGVLLRRDPPHVRLEALHLLLQRRVALMHLVRRGCCGRSLLSGRGRSCCMRLQRGLGRRVGAARRRCGCEVRARLRELPIELLGSCLLRREIRQRLFCLALHERQLLLHSNGEIQMERHCHHRRLLPLALQTERQSYPGRASPGLWWSQPPLAMHFTLLQPGAGQRAEGSHMRIPADMACMLEPHAHGSTPAAPRQVCLV